MPIYEYICENKKCTEKEKKVEITSSIDDRDKQKCPKCKKKLKRLLTIANLNWM